MKMATMTIARLHDLFDENSAKDSLLWQGACHDCQSDVKVEATLEADGIHIKGGSVYEPETDKFLMKCDSCFVKDSVLRK